MYQVIRVNCMGMNFDNMFPSHDSGNVEQNKQFEQTIDEAVRILDAQGVEVHPMVLESFLDPSFFKSLPEGIKKDPLELTVYIGNSSRFADAVTSQRSLRAKGDETGLLGKNVDIPETAGADGTVRPAESGQLFQTEALRKMGINPDYVLFFRLTQPADEPKPEAYWTSDFYESQRGLQQEISGEKRARAVTLVAGLTEIDRDGGLIQDRNDDGGMSVRRITQQPFDQNRSLAIIPPTHTYVS